MATNNKSEGITHLLDMISSMTAKNSGRGMSRSSALAQDKCAKCGGDASVFTAEITRREYSLTAWCEDCQHEIFRNN